MEAEKPACTTMGCNGRARYRSPGPCAGCRSREHRANQGPCRVESCDERATAAQGLCPGHYRRERAGVDLAEPLVRRQKRDGHCSVAGCVEKIYGKRLCGMHYGRMLTKGAVGPASPLKASKGAGSTDTNGYRYVTVERGRRTAEHRYVMEKILGRPLRPFETVHHKNGRRADNEPANLELWTKPQPAGQRPEDLVAWVVENYPDLVEQEMRARQNVK